MYEINMDERLFIFFFINKCHKNCFANGVLYVLHNVYIVVNSTSF